MIRFNHIEVTVPPGFVAANRTALNSFFVDMFDFRTAIFPGLETPNMVFTTDEDGSQFIFIAEHSQPAEKMSDDHLGFHLDSETEVEEKLALCASFQMRDERLEIRDLGILDLEATKTRGFYVRYLLPIWFDIQHIVYKPGYERTHGWRFTAVEPTLPK